MGTLSGGVFVARERWNPLVTGVATLRTGLFANFPFVTFKFGQSLYRNESYV